MDENEKYEPSTLAEYEVDLENVDFEEGDEVDEVEEVEEETSDEVVEEPAEQSPDVKEQTNEDSDVKNQTSEQNAYYAEQRRQQLVQQRVQQELQKMQQEAPEFQMAKLLSEMYGMPVNDLYKELQEKQMEKQAEQKGVPVEVMKQLNAYEQQQAELQEQLYFMQFQNWQNRVDEETKTMQNQYPMLNAEDIEQAKYFLLDTLQNPEIPLQNAVFALHGDKIAKSLKELAKQEALAEISGRKKGGLPPQSMKTTDTKSITDEERYVAKMMGLSEADYIKYK
jgi:hypothetical protein